MAPQHSPAFLKLVQDTKARVKECTVDDMKARLARNDKFSLIDVREESEFAAGHIPGAVHIAYHDLREPPAVLDRGRPVAVLCSSGQRAAVGASLLQRHGFERVLHIVEGGMPLWTRSGWPLET